MHDDILEKFPRDCKEFFASRTRTNNKISHGSRLVLKILTGTI